MGVIDTGLNIEWVLIQLHLLWAQNRYSFDGVLDTALVGVIDTALVGVIDTGS